jgi:hypothetical protein
MLQPINPVLPQIAENPYAINLAMPNVTPIETEQKLTQISAMKQQALMQQQQMAIQQQNTMINAEMQRQRIRQADEMHQFQKQKFEQDQMDKLSLIRDTTAKQFDKLLNMPILSKDDADFLEAKKKHYEIDDTLYDLIATGDRVQVEGATANLRNFMKDPEVIQYMQKAGMYTKMIESYDPKKNNPRFLLEADNLYDRVDKDGTPIKGLGIANMPMSMLSAGNYYKTPNANLITDKAIERLSKGNIYPDENTSDEYINSILNELYDEGVDITSDVQALVESKAKALIVSDDEVISLARAVAGDQYNPSDVYEILKLASKSGRAAMQKQAATIRSEAVKLSIAAQNNETKVGIAEMKQKSANQQIISSVSGTGSGIVKNALNMLVDDFPDLNLTNGLSNELIQIQNEHGLAGEDLLNHYSFNKLEKDRQKSLVEDYATSNIGEFNEITEITFDGDRIKVKYTVPGLIREEIKTRNYNLRDILKSTPELWVNHFNKVIKEQPSLEPPTQKPKPATTTMDFTPLTNAVAKEVYGTVLPIVNDNPTVAAYLTSLIESESGFKNVKNPNSTAEGVLQMLKGTWESFNTKRKLNGEPEYSREEFAALPPYKQVELALPHFIGEGEAAEKFLKDIDGAKISLLLFAPSLAKSGRYTTENRQKTIYSKGDVEYANHVSLDRGKKGYITVADVMSRSLSKLEGMTEAYKDLSEYITIKPRVISVLDKNFTRDLGDALSEYHKKTRNKIRVTEMFRDPLKKEGYGSLTSRHYAGGAIDIGNEEGKPFFDWLKAEQGKGKYPDLDIQFHAESTKNTGDHYHLEYKPIVRGIKSSRIQEGLRNIEEKEKAIPGLIELYEGNKDKTNNSSSSTKGIAKWSADMKKASKK